MAETSRWMDEHHDFFSSFAGQSTTGDLPTLPDLPDDFEQPDDFEAVEQ